MKLKTLAVITLVVLGSSFASAQVGTFYFWDTVGDNPSCDYLVITYNSGGIVAGYDDLMECGGNGLNAPHRWFRRHHR